MPAPKRPTSVMVLAILNLIFGCLQLIGVVIGIILVAMIFNLSPAPLPAAPADPTDPIGAAKEQYQFLMNESPNYKNFNIAGTVVGVIDALLLIVSGIGLLKMQKWARAACFMYVALGLVFTAISTSYQFTAIVPATEKYEKERNAKLTALKKPTPPAMAGITATAGAGLNAFCGFLYPVVVLGLLMAPSARKAFSGTAEPEEGRARDEFDDLDADRPLRRRTEGDANGPRDDDTRFRDTPDR